MKLQKQQLQKTILIIILVIVIAGFGIFVKNEIVKTEIAKNQKSTENNDIDLSPRPIEELFASDFSGIADNSQAKCDRSKILSEREKLVNEKRLNTNDVDGLTLNNECLWMYEGNDFRFSFRDYGNHIFYLKNSTGKVLSLIDYSNDSEENNVYITKDDNPSVNQYIDYLIKTFYSYNSGLLSTQKSRKNLRNTSKLVNLKHYKNKFDVSVYKVTIKDCISPNGYSSCEYVNRDFIVLGSDNITLFVKNGSPELIKDFLATIELKKR